ncbi:MAG: alpha/beta fold hydrolase [Acidimicrobiales bacterium]
MPQLEANGIRIEYDVRGEGPPILFVMGLAGQLTDWPDEVMDLFVDRGYQTIRFDNRDIGLSSRDSWKPPGRMQLAKSFLTRRPVKGCGYTIPDMAADAAGLLDGLGIESAHVVGVSMGGMIVQEMAINHPEKVRSMCSIMSNTGDRKNGGIAAGLLGKLARNGEPTAETAVDDVVELFRLISGPHFDPVAYRSVAEQSVARSFDRAGVSRQTAAIAGSRDRTELLGSVTAPTLVIHGLVDPLVKPSGGIATVKAIPGARLLMFPDMGHDLPAPRIAEIRDAVIANFARA